MSLHIHIIGTGSPFGDDRFGWEAAQALGAAAAIRSVPRYRLKISILDRPGAMLPRNWNGTDVVILLDAVRSGATPGTRHCLDAQDLPAAGGLSSSHGFGLVSAIRLAQALGNMPLRLLIRGMEADPDWQGFSLSPAVIGALPGFIADITEELSEMPGFSLPDAANLA